MTQYYTKIQQGRLGPLSEQEVAEMIREGALPLDALVSQVGQQDWMSPKDMPQFALLLQEPTRAAPSSKEGAAGKQQRESEGEEETEGEEEGEEEGEQKLTKYQLLSSICEDLESMADRQVESILAQIRGRDLEDDLVKTKKQQEEVKRGIRDAAIEYWRRSGQLKKWIAEYVWTDEVGKKADRRRRLKGTAPEKYENVCGWLEKLGYLDKAGCYCFLDGKGYVYVGMTERSLGQRIKEHEDKIWWESTDSFRVIIPNDKRRCEPLERLLILNYTPLRSKTDGTSGNNPADDILEMIDKEIEELANDQPVG